jgi:transcriptional regulator with XRE-family HTH domain
MTDVCQIGKEKDCPDGSGDAVVVIDHAVMAKVVRPEPLNLIRQERLRKKPRMSLEDLAEKAGLSTSYVSRLERGERRLNIENLQKFAQALDISPTRLVEAGLVDGQVPPHPQYNVGMLRVIGEVAAGMWREVSLAEASSSDAEDGDPYPPIPHVMDARYPGLRQFALRVTGNSMNEKFPDGGYVICVNYWDARREKRDGDYVVVERIDGAKYEYTIKRLKRSGKGWELRPESSDPRYQRPVRLTEATGTERDNPDITVELKGLVIWASARI